ncbi:flagellar basal body-associated protein FliL [Shewanella avicenniae]|uniref:Flagellar protein FliL n=1 Tax=Shewanella avicenniae TaxID=2814294 RepID=A0ABX7QMQ7_9GAMM|nr:flagellar basal body-associated protein FliL [Shewanella avicenniae]QSX32718.1 flagellar basal body-associated protein FliL [Shewanella avicenniae]
MAEQQLELAEKGGKSKKMLFIIIAVVVILAGGGAAAFFLLGSSEEAPAAAETAAPAATDPAAPAMGNAAYVPMPRPFLFNVAGAGRSRLVEIKVQLMVRGEENEITLQKHIPLVEDALLTTFSGASEEKLSTLAGKDELRQVALLNVQNTLQPITGRKVVEKVLFTGFVMQ